MCVLFLFLSKCPTWNDKDKPRCQALRPLAFFGLLGFWFNRMDGRMGAVRVFIGRLPRMDCADDGMAITQRGWEAGRFSRPLGSGLRR